MRTRNSGSLEGPDESALDTTATTRVDDRQPRLPPPTVRTQPDRRPPPAPPPSNPRPQPPPPVSHTQPPQQVSNLATSPRHSPSRMPPPQQRPPPPPPPVLSPPQRDGNQSPPATDLPRTATVMAPPPPPPHVPPPMDLPVATHRPNRLLPASIPESRNWILQVRLPTASLSSSGGVQPMTQPPTTKATSTSITIRKVQMTTHSNMDATTLSHCLQQCLNYYPNHITGLFCETTHTFYSLQHILSWDDTWIEERQDSIYTVELPIVTPWQQQEQQQVGDDRFWTKWYYYIFDAILTLFDGILANLYILVPIIVAIAFYYQQNLVRDGISMTYTTVYSTMIEQPLRDIYHYGPWFIGWEGDDISTICARITYHGDAHFWLRNMNECERIYSAKEQAFIRIVLPFIYIICAVLLVYTIRFLLQEYQNYQFQLHNNHRNPLERDMADLYHSFHVILRQILQVHNNQQRPAPQQKHRL